MKDKWVFLFLWNIFFVDSCNSLTHIHGYFTDNGRSCEGHSAIKIILTEKCEIHRYQTTAKHSKARTTRLFLWMYVADAIVKVALVCINSANGWLILDSKSSPDPMEIYRTNNPKKITQRIFCG